MIVVIAGISAVLAVYFVLKIAFYSTLMRNEIKAALERDPAARNSLSVILSYPGVRAIFYHRIARFLYKRKVRFFPRYISQYARWLTGIEIHPGTTIGKGLFIDHGMGVVIGETTVIGDNVTLFQGVTLGGTGKERGKRHPTLGNNVVVGTGACILGNIRIGDNVNVGANAVVIREVPPNSTVVGVPGRIASRDGKKMQGINLDHCGLPDPVAQALDRMQNEIHRLKKELKDLKDPSHPEKDRKSE